MSEMYELRVTSAVWRSALDDWNEGWSIEEYSPDGEYVRGIAVSADHPFTTDLNVAANAALEIAWSDYANEVQVVLPSAEYTLSLPKVSDHAR